MEEIDAVEDEFFMEEAYKGTYKPNVILKDGFQTSELQQGVDFEVKDKYRDDDDESHPHLFFDGEDTFQALNFDVLDGANDGDPDQDKGPFMLMMEKMTSLTEDGGVCKMIVKRGTGPIVTPGAICRVHYNGYLEYRDEPFDSTRLRNRLHQIQLGDPGNFILGFDVAIATMRKGETSKFLFSPYYAYREMGCPPRIPPNKSVLFEIELVSFVDPTASHELTMEERNKASFENANKDAESLKEEGNRLFRQNEFYTAIKKYDKGIQLLENCRVKDETEEKKLNDVLKSVYLNASLCALKLGQGVRAKKYARKALDINPRDIKAIFRIGQGCQKEGEFPKAREWFLRAQRQEPNNKEIRDALKKLDQDVRRWKLSESQICRRMFSETKPSSPVTAEENIALDEKAPTGISEEVKTLMLKRLHDFQADDKENVIVFPSSLTTKEVTFLADEAKKNNLYCITPSKKVAYLKILKEKPE